ncbi:NADH:flavin oxidoreductase/NADH oxidase family protein [Parasphingopyxis lamellibrachiae]|uniref:2,4-dienoyl-CoA reductase-like NADH-dependent reductase (Old Yellow Enzyme family) n=1 Tax=Parasphingopyxis lamellibrachiae TaxID=680125 RepID=A0A3D9FDU2_9SPHN|nr:NADH:flavin oxidoreductase/NADH oxidase family protein [Parasphingopyxis lamellibrachiae]RED15995.1 2,4-dienoyl-CoA reductase-like NADH-dependent reductase (Old Yellow Enzyme family) [Parasphingopyxis lamellibrachiae]
MSAPALTEPLSLPCGAILPNRIAKAAMTEGLATADGVPTDELERLYGLWSDGGAGMLLSGNIQVDRDHLERPGNVVIQGEPDAGLRSRLERWAKTATRGGNHFWAQISHAGRQTQAAVNPHPKAPSAVKLGLPGGQFGEPVALTIDEIHDIRDRFAIAAKTVKETGFTGAQIHAAHGYLLSSFLSPRANQRDDIYGGSLENRARFLLETVAAVRDAVGPDFPIAVKLNSADFQRGGFRFEDSLQVAQWLGQAGIDLLEISGGNYEQPKLLGIEGMESEETQNVAPSTARREAYFVDFALAMQEKVTVPLMVTGGFRSRAAMDYALESGAADIVGIGRPFCHMPDAAKRLFAGLDALPTPEDNLALIPGWLGFLKRFQLFKAIDGFATTYWFYSQLYALGRTGNTVPDRSVFAAFREVEATHKQLMKERSEG